MNELPNGKDFIITKLKWLLHVGKRHQKEVKKTTNERYKLEKAKKEDELNGRAKPPKKKKLDQRKNDWSYW